MVGVGIDCSNIFMHVYNFEIDKVHESEKKHFLYSK